MSSIKVYYRISDAGNPKKIKLDFATKLNCFQNALASFPNSNFIVFADNCTPELLSSLKQFNFEVIELSLGNSKSFMYAVDYAIKNENEDEIVYFLEDDYLHIGQNETYLTEALTKADYTTLYDHPDYYNHPVHEGLREVFLTNSSHWQIVKSTTMTFAVKVKTLKNDYFIWQLACSRPCPKDFLAFKFLRLFNVLRFRKNRKLATPIPGRSTHAEVDFIAPFFKL